MRKIIILLSILGSYFVGHSQYQFSGAVDSTFQEGRIYLSVVEDYRKISGVYPEQILQKQHPKSLGSFTFTGNNLPMQNRIYRIHVDTCPEDDENVSHFMGHCENSKEILFIASNNDSISLPFSFDNEMFCKIISNSQKAKTILQIDSIKNDMRYAFGTFRSEANRKINTEKWFKTLQNFGEDQNEPLAELYIYSFLSDRANDLHAYYLEDLKVNNYYRQLLARLQEKYPNAYYTKQYEAELNADTFLVTGKKETSIPWWIYLLAGVAFLSILGNFYFFGKARSKRVEKSTAINSLSQQEKKVLDLILQNKTNKEIASEMFVSLSTVKTHINNLYKKLKVASRDEVISLYNK